MAKEYKLISADSHINEPPEMFIDRVPAKFKDRAPRMEHFEKGDAWVMEGAVDPLNFGNNCAAGIPPEERSAWVKWENVRKGGYDPKVRLEEQDVDETDAELFYPTPRVSNQLFFHNSDPEFHIACIRAYNDWLAEYCSYNPERLWGTALMPTCGTDAAVEELNRTMALPGMKSVLLGQYPHGGEVISEEDDPFWAAAAAANVPVAVHVGFALAPQGDAAKMKVTGSLRFFDAPIRATQFIESGVFDRFPDLRLVLVEVDASWIPYMREQMDDRFFRTATSGRPNIKRAPSEYFTDNILSTFVTDHYGIQNRAHVGVKQMMWSSDYPHTGSDWPHSWKTINDHFEGVPEDEKYDILAGNALRLYSRT